MTAPNAPWELSGDCMLALVWRDGTRPELPQGLQPLPGPTLVAAARHASSPVGPYLELVVATPARLGARAGLCITTMVVDSAESRVGGRLNWGFPKELGTLRWSAEGDSRELVWEERGVLVRGAPVGPGVPMVLPVHALQRRADGPVVVPCRLRGLVRVSRVAVSVPDGDALAGLAGQHAGAVVRGYQLVVAPARRPAGAAATRRAPLQAPEPALSWDGGGD